MSCTLPFSMVKPRRPLHRHPVTLAVAAVLTAALLVVWVGEIDLGLDALLNPGPTPQRPTPGLPKPAPGSAPAPEAGPPTPPAPTPGSP